MNWQKIIKQQFPRMNSVYSEALAHPNTESMLKSSGILENPLRIAHFFATVGVESAGMTALRENMNYSSRQITNIFGVGRHSAAVDPTEAIYLAKRPQELAERVYGLGNPTKARELGNRLKGDGFEFRGTGPLQLTGRKNIENALDVLHLASVEDLIAPANLFASAVRFWVEAGCNTLADKDDARSVRRRINGGYNGFDEFQVMKNKILSALTKGAPVSVKSDSEVMILQQDLIRLGFLLKRDGIYGPATTAAVKEFQRINGLKVDGIAGPATRAVIDQRLSNTRSAPQTIDERDVEGAISGAGTGAVSLGAIGEMVISTAREIGGMGLDSPLLRIIPAALMVVGLGLILYPHVKSIKS